MWPVIRRTSVPPTEMSKDRRPHQTLPPAVLLGPRAAGGSATTRDGPAHRAQLHSLDPHRSPPSGVPRRWHRRCLTDRHRQRWSDDRRIPPPGARPVVHRMPGRSPVRRRTRTAQAPARGRGRSRGTAPPRNHCALRPPLALLLPNSTAELFRVGATALLLTSGEVELSRIAAVHPVRVGTCPGGGLEPCPGRGSRAAPACGRRPFRAPTGWSGSGGCSRPPGCVLHARRRQRQARLRVGLRRRARWVRSTRRE